MTQNPVPRLVLAAVALATTIVAQFREPPRAVDHNPDPRVFETVLTATATTIEFVAGKPTPAMAFNGSVPGPTIDAVLGDTLIVHFVNMLSESTILHWHGVSTPSTMDGSELSQVAVPRSGYHRYEFQLNCAGTFWYHPHLNTNEQIEKGLYGALLVRDPLHESALGIPVADEHILFVDDIKLDADGHTAPFASNPGAAFVPYERAEDLANSRMGNHVLLNGREVVGAGERDQLPTLDVRAGAPYRLRLISPASGRIFRFDLSPGDSKLFAVGSDQGLWNAAELVLPIDKVKNDRGHHNELISNPDVRLGTTLTPGDRLEVVLVAAGDVGDEVFLLSHDFVKGKHIAYLDPEGRLLFGHDHFDGAEPEQPLLRIRIVAAGEEPAWTPPATLRWDPTPLLQPDPDAMPLPVFLGHSPPNPADGNLMFFLRVTKEHELLQAVRAHQPVLPIDHDPRPMMKQGAEEGFRVRVGETRCFEVVNFTGNDHNLHIHGFRFQHVSTEHVDLDEPPRNRYEEPLRLAFEDTIRIPMRPGLVLGRSYTIVRLAIRFADDDLAPTLRRTTDELLAGGLSPSATRSGGWMLHCHFLEHSARGMMSFVTVER